MRLHGGGAPVTATAPKPPAGLGPRGRKLWGLLGDEGLLKGPQLMLAEEACRQADRLEKLDRLLRGDVECWARIVQKRGEDHPPELVINAAAAESRASQTTLLALLTRLQGPTAKGKTTTTTPEATSDGVDDIAAARARRLAGPSGTASP